jgi:hypothetical protein
MDEGDLLTGNETASDVEDNKEEEKEKEEKDKSMETSARAAAYQRR